MVNGAHVMILGEIRPLLVHASLHGPPERNCENKGRMMSEATTALILKAQYCNRSFHTDYSQSLVTKKHILIMS
jgi:hypothetical protein